MKLGKKELERWRVLAALFAEFEDRWDPLEFSEGPVPSTPPTPPLVAEHRLPDSVGFERPRESQGLEVQNLLDGDEEEPKTEDFQGDGDLSTRLEVSAFESFGAARAFFQAAPWKAGKGVGSALSASDQPSLAPAVVPTEQVAAGIFFSAAPWTLPSSGAGPKGDRGWSNLDKLMALATSQAVSKSRRASSGNRTSLSGSGARAFFSQAPWKQTT